MTTAAYWDQVADRFEADNQSPTWRAYMQRCYLQLAHRWFADVPPGLTLKTDLFEEAVTPYHLFDGLGEEMAGMDLSLAIVRAARHRLQRREHGDAALAVCDSRRLPWASHSMMRILSGSSLDHFEETRDIDVALGELVRCLRPGGCLVVTFDNPHNPLVRLRNALPFRALARIGLVPYFVGATYDRHTAQRVLTALGLTVTHVEAMAHAPRAPAIWAGRQYARRSGNPSPQLLRLLSAFDRVFARSPLRFLTGYYVALRAVKPAHPPSHGGASGG
jgi:ubiquinone/menaquinone biosynthesis C-methylase UbiE